MRATTIVLAVTLGAAPRAAGAAPQRVAPAKPRLSERIAAWKARDHSQGGTRRGGLEIGLGVVTLGICGVLVGRGVWELRRGRASQRRCEADPTCEDAPPGRANTIAAGLSLGFAVPVGVGSALLFAYGARIHRDARAWRNKRAALRWMPLPGGAGIGLEGRF